VIWLLARRIHCTGAYYIAHYVAHYIVRERDSKHVKVFGKKAEPSTLAIIWLIEKKYHLNTNWLG